MQVWSGLKEAVGVVARWGMLLIAGEGEDRCHN